MIVASKKMGYKLFVEDRSLACCEGATCRFVEMLSKTRG